MMNSAATAPPADRVSAAGVAPAYRFRRRSAAR
jgi:hypothetical protein